MPPADPHDEPIDIVARPVKPDGTVGEPEPAPEPDTTEVAFPDRQGGGSGRAEVRYWRFETAGNEGCGCGGCGCLMLLLALLGLTLLRGCASLVFR